VSQDEKSLGMIVSMAECTASTNVVSPGAAWTVSGARPAKKPTTAVPAAPGGYEEIQNPSSWSDPVGSRRIVWMING